MKKNIIELFVVSDRCKKPIQRKRFNFNSPRDRKLVQAYLNKTKMSLTEFARACKNYLYEKENKENDDLGTFVVLSQKQLKLK